MLPSMACGGQIGQRGQRGQRAEGRGQRAEWQSGIGDYETVHLKWPRRASA